MQKGIFSKDTLGEVCAQSCYPDNLYLLFSWFYKFEMFRSVLL